MWETKFKSPPPDAEPGFERRSPIHCGLLKKKKEVAENALELCTNESPEAERCESIELDDEIRNLIEKNSIAQYHENSEFIAQECVLRQMTSCSLKTCSKTDIQSLFRLPQTGMNGAETSSDQLQSTLLTKKKIPTDTLEQQIRILERQRQELLEVNKQWDQQFRSMKQHYEKKLAEVKAKLGASQRSISELEKERHQNQQECERLQALARDGPLQEAKEKEILNEALNELKEENKLLKEQKASVTKKKEYYECEISRLNKALLDALQKQHLSVFVPHLDKSDRSCSHEEMRTQLEVLRQQVQIYEEDFKKERSDRERLNEEKEALQKLNERSQSELNKLNSQIKACWQEKELLEKQLKQQTKDLPVPSEKCCFLPQMFLPPCVNYGNCGLVLHYQDPRVQMSSRGMYDQQQHPPDYQWYVPDQFPPDVQHKANDTSSEKEVHH
ncbi:TNFAIP3-interacting protein 3 isoform X1 [Mauremys mutica]|uniref:TNFAIP3-interacting protein 3 isoform X1 n=2 Tax=Mauremys mutica TaxID=74926 RepID=UPI001D15F1B8|nr:TNFAIP3-interacting protein 3 isoform X1 [Mauremys mutica]